MIKKIRNRQDKNPKVKYRRAVCTSCDCVFVFDSDSVEAGDRNNRGYYYAVCPECGNRKYINDTVINTVELTKQEFDALQNINPDETPDTAPDIDPDADTDTDEEYVPLMVRRKKSEATE